ncbi:Sec-independent protein translocase protein TatB [Sedimenticola sp.]|uniref:Sec-independent protein translocase protein TatB n=1 Tax=Sedimenticola sp. TaxID=1940285 RepID=UPI003D0B8ABB
MFDIGFWELAIVGLVALLVVGPERLPKLAYTAGKWLGKGRKMIQQVKNEIDKEIKAEELKQILEEQKKEISPLEEIVEETSETLRDFTQEANKSVREMEQTAASEDDSQERSSDTSK